MYIQLKYALGHHIGWNSHKHVSKHHLFGFTLLNKIVYLPLKPTNFGGLCKVFRKFFLDSLKGLKFM